MAVIHNQLCSKAIILMSTTRTAVTIAKPAAGRRLVSWHIPKSKKATFVTNREERESINNNTGEA